MAKAKTNHNHTTRSNKVNWQNFDKLIVIKKLRQIVGEWWNIQMHFTDEKGFLRGVPSGKFFSPRNPISQAIVSNETGFKLTMQDVRKTTVDASFTNTQKLVTNSSGFSALLVPVKIKGQNLGCVFADGFLSEDTSKEQKQKIRDFLGKIFFSQAEQFYQHLDKLPVLTTKDQSYLSELIKVVVIEMLQSEYKLKSEQEKVQKLKNQLQNQDTHWEMVGKSQVMSKLYSLIKKVSDTESTVLIRGENGTGKELIAKALHNHSIRHKQNFLTVNCGAFNDNLLESELFGHVKGSFTGASKDKVGLFEAAHNGTLFLDEVGDTSLHMQVKLLRVLQEGTYTPVGSTQLKHAKVRIIAATNRNLEEMITEGLFREDLFYRLNVILLEVPSLRDRKEDIPILADYFLKKHQKKSNNSKEFCLSSACLDILINYHWPGNVRELENEMERLSVLTEDSTISDQLLSRRIRDHQFIDPEFNFNHTQGLNLNALLQIYEQKIIDQGLKTMNWDKSKLAKRLDLSLKMLESKIAKFDLDKRKLGEQKAG